MANAFNDARCPKCSKRFGWTGKMTDRPPCPGCGLVVDMTEDQKEMDKFEQMLLAKDKNNKLKDSVILACEKWKDEPVILDSRGYDRIIKEVQTKHPEASLDKIDRLIKKHFDWRGEE